MEEEYDFDSVNIISDLFLKLNLPLFNKVFLESFLKQSSLLKIQELYRKMLLDHPVEANRPDAKIIPSKKIKKKLTSLQTKNTGILTIENLPFEIIFKYLK